MYEAPERKALRVPKRISTSCAFIRDEDQCNKSVDKNFMQRCSFNSSMKRCERIPKNKRKLNIMVQSEPVRDVEFERETRMLSEMV